MTMTATKEKPIMFSEPMVKAILAGNKTMTRRVVKRDRKYSAYDYYPGDRWWMGPHPVSGFWGIDVPTGPTKEMIEIAKQSTGFACPFHVGTRLWVKTRHWHYHPPSTNTRNEQIWDEVTREVRWPSGEVIPNCEPAVHDSPWGGPGTVGWHRKSPLFMPRWASRITLEVTAVKVERLNDISEVDAYSEGFRTEPCKRCDERGEEAGEPCPDCAGDGRFSCTQGFVQLWETINGKGSWAANPWVWCYSFKRV